MNKILYYDNEGQDNIKSTMSLVADVIVDRGCQAVIFSIKGDGPKLIVDKYPKLKEKIIIVSYPSGMKEGENDENRTDELKKLKDDGFRVVISNPAFRDIYIPEGIDIKKRAIIETLRLFSTGMILCVEAILLARDANELVDNEIVVSACSDTAIIATAVRTELLFYPSIGMEIQEIICKPRVLNISRQGKYESEKDKS
ncbi:MAG: hypothetical protein NTW26_06735 [bacterium]|nr:hypothetical protein [bacterium]